MITRKTKLDEILSLKNECSQCNHCCSYSSCYFLDEDIKRISKELGYSEEKFKEKFLEENIVFNTKVHRAKQKKGSKPYGPCIFLKKNCSIHEIKPLHCRVGSGCSEHGEEISQWFVLNYIVNPKDPGSVREWAAFLKDNKTIPGGGLKELAGEKQLKEIMEYSEINMRHKDMKHKDMRHKDMKHKQPR